MPYLALLTTILIWGLGAIVAKEAFTEIDPYILMFLRFAIAAIVTAPLIFFKKDQPDIRTKDIAKLSMLTFLATGIGAGCWVIGIYYTTAIHAAIIGAIGPVLVLPLERIILKRKAKPIVYVASAVALVGALLITVTPTVSIDEKYALFNGLSGSVLLGNLLIFASSFGIALYIVLAQKVQTQYKTYQKTALSFTVAWVVSLPFALIAHYSNPGWIVEAGVKTWGAVLYFGVGASAIAYLCWQWATEKLPPINSSVFFYFQPIITIAAAFFILHEIPGTVEIIGGIIILTAVATVLLAQRRKDKV